MWDIFKGILGLPSLENPGKSRSYSDNTFEEKESMDRLQIWNNGNEESLMEDLVNKQIKQLQAMLGMTFTFDQFSSNNSFDDIDESPQEPDSPGHIRDQFFKPGLSNNVHTDSDLDGEINNGDIEMFFNGESSRRNRLFGMEWSSLENQPRVFSRSVISRTVRRPDGKVETVRTERDHTGREETTVTEYEPNKPLPHGDDVLFKFFKM